MIESMIVWTMLSGFPDVWVQRFEDVEKQVTCWVVNDGIHCIPNTQLKKESK